MCKVGMCFLFFGIHRVIYDLSRKVASEFETNLSHDTFSDQTLWSRSVQEESKRRKAQRRCVKNTEVWHVRP
jgi:hypothetical protein